MVWLPISVYFTVCVSLYTYMGCWKVLLKFDQTSKFKKKCSGWELTAPPCICDFLKCAFPPPPQSNLQISLHISYCNNQSFGLDHWFDIVCLLERAQNEMSFSIIGGKIFLQMICKLFQLKSFIRKLEFFSNLFEDYWKGHTLD